MSAAGRDRASASTASDVAAAAREADFVRLVARADGDALAATGVLARALSARGTPFQATVARPFEDADRGTDADLTVAVGHDGTADHRLRGRPASAAAAAVVEELGAEPDATLALAGAVAAGDPGAIPAAPERAGAERRPGVAVPVPDLADGLAHTTLVHAPVSGDESRAADALADLDVGDDVDDEDRRRVASLVALSVVGDADATERATEAVERALRPYAGGPFETLGGYADVLDATARERPGIAVALALGGDVREAALSAWRDHADQAHAAVRGADVARYEGLSVLRDAAPVGTVARLAADFRSPEPVTVATSGDEAAVRSTDGRDVADAVAAAADAADGEAVGRGDRARARIDDADAFVVALREAL
ncbi:hypothetical protein [Halomicrobium salinisoli]|uniref:hypothetical protein n=1 Tax=Halomicrobium salinisoli TaxID=2878391 RepID=UPI001CEFB2DF|nr:hypothetical protein [Halomicrobium salinisoli]